MIAIRRTAPDEARAASNTMRSALMSGPIADDKWEAAAPAWSADVHTSFSAWDGDECVGHAGAFHLRTTVPGGARVATAGVTRVGVLPTHTRRGLLTGMMREMLTTTRGAGMVLASLRASETLIYGRYGFGMAGCMTDIEIDTTQGALRSDPGVGGRYRRLGSNELMLVLPALYERIAHRRAGEIERPEWMWRRFLDDLLGDARPARWVVVHEDDTGAIDGFIDYEIETKTVFPDHWHNTAVVLDAYGATPAVEAAMWGHVLGQDLLHVVRSEERPLDLGLRWWLADVRALKVRNVTDEQWVRLLDVGAALAARTYSPGPAVRIAVTDAWFPENDGCWVVDETGGTGRDGGPADLRGDIAHLGAAYMGGTSWWDLCQSGRIEECRAGAAADADARFASRPLPWCGSFF